MAMVGHLFGIDFSEYSRKDYTMEMRDGYDLQLKMKEVHVRKRGESVSDGLFHLVGEYCVA